jgi:hypothetical protein
MGIKRLMLLILVGMLCGISPGIWAAGKPVFQLGVSTTQYLPPPMYGTWQVKATLISSNYPQFFPPTSEDIWTLAQDGQTVTLTNPSTGAFATIDVTEVKGNLARFSHRVTMGRNRQFEENPSVTVMDDRLFGQTRNRLLVSRKGQVAQTYVAEYRLEATRIGGSRIQFGQPPQTDYPEFDIEPIQKAPAKPLRYPFQKP